MEPPRHWFARPLTSRGDFASAPASLQACFPTYTVRSCDPLSLPQARPRTQLPSPSDWQTAPGTARGCMDLPGHTRAHACTRKGTHTLFSKWGTSSTFLMCTYLSFLSFVSVAILYLFYLIYLFYYNLISRLEELCLFWFMAWLSKY